MKKDFINAYSLERADLTAHSFHQQSLVTKEHQHA